ncbi:MAG: hypothetical protein ABI343_17120 [Burkholderiaceae bacterium]
MHSGNQQAQPENKLLVAVAPPTVSVGTVGVEASQLAASLAQAKRAWAETGISAEQFATLDAVQLMVADLPGLTLGEAEDGLITIDVNASGYGWFVHLPTVSKVTPTVTML